MKAAPAPFEFLLDPTDEAHVRPGPQIRHSEWIANYAEYQATRHLHPRELAKVATDRIVEDLAPIEGLSPTAVGLRSCKTPLRRGVHPRVIAILNEPDQPSRPLWASSSPKNRFVSRILLPDSPWTGLPLKLEHKARVYRPMTAQTKARVHHKPCRFLLHLRRGSTSEGSSCTRQKAFSIIIAQGSKRSVFSSSESAGSEHWLEADAFSRRHRHRNALAERATFESDSGHLQVLNEETQRAQHELPGRVRELRRNRIIISLPTEDDSGENSDRPDVPFDVYKSIWQPRVLSADSGDLVDSDEVRLTRFCHEWADALRMGLVKVIIADPTYDSNQIVDEVPDEVQLVGEVLWKHARLISVVFANYASLSLRLNGMTFQSWMAFVTECALVDKNSTACKVSDLEHVFRETSIENDCPDAAKELRRPGFMIALVRLAINTYIANRQLNEVSSAVDRILGVLVQARIDTQVAQEPDVFRLRFCYIQPTCAILQTNAKVLRRCFDCLCRLSFDGQVKAQVDACSAEQWLRSMRALHMIDVDLSEYDALRCFAWSRMVVGNYHTQRGRHEDTHLAFEGFLEAICRLAALKALPPDQEVKEWAREEGHPANVGEYLQHLRIVRRKVALEMMSERKIEWGEYVPIKAFRWRLQRTIEILQHEVNQFKPPWVVPLEEARGPPPHANL